MSKRSLEQSCWHHRPLRLGRTEKTSQDTRVALTTPQHLTANTPNDSTNAHNREKEIRTTSTDYSTNQRTIQGGVICASGYIPLNRRCRGADDLSIIQAEYFLTGVCMPHPKKTCLKLRSQESRNKIIQDSCWSWGTLRCRNSALHNPAHRLSRQDKSHARVFGVESPCCILNLLTMNRWKNDWEHVTYTVV